MPDVDESMNRFTRRSLLLSTAALSLGCAARQSRPGAPGNEDVLVRPPELGQSWRYAQFDYFTGERLDTQRDQVVSIGDTIKVKSEFEREKVDPVQYPSWGKAWWQKYVNASATEKYPPSEIHDSWGVLVVDPHWTQLQAYEKPLPLWPRELRQGWWTIMNTNYRIPGSDEGMPWQLDMHAVQWESITVPAGQFTALRYYNLFNFRYTNASGRNAGQRKETIWFAPKIGRWVARESSGTFRQDVSEEFNENSYRWELLGWT
jgi:hypothetical protein